MENVNHYFRMRVVESVKPNKNIKSRKWINGKNMFMNMSQRIRYYIASGELNLKGAAN